MWRRLCEYVEYVEEYKLNMAEYVESTSWTWPNASRIRQKHRKNESPRGAKCSNDKEKKDKKRNSERDPAMNKKEEGVPVLTDNIAAKKYQQIIFAAWIKKSTSINIRSMNTSIFYLYIVFFFNNTISTYSWPLIFFNNTISTII